MKPNHINEQCAAISQPTELKPCPFCGKENTNTPYDPNKNLKGYTGNFYVRPPCRCIAQYGIPVKTWNTRALDTLQPPDAALVAALELVKEKMNDDIEWDDLNHIHVVIDKALANHRAGKQWSDEYTNKLEQAILRINAAYNEPANPSAAVKARTIESALMRALDMMVDNAEKITTPPGGK